MRHRRRRVEGLRQPAAPRPPAGLVRSRRASRCGGRWRPPTAGGAGAAARLRRAAHGRRGGPRGAAAMSERCLRRRGRTRAPASPARPCTRARPERALAPHRPALPGGLGACADRGTTPRISCRRRSSTCSSAPGCCATATSSATCCGRCETPTPAATARRPPPDASSS